MKKLPIFTLGVEEEYQIIDPVTRDLRSHLSKIVDGAKIILNEQVKAEMHQSVVEVGTNICNSVSDARNEIRFLRSKIVELAHKQELIVGGAGTHPLKCLEFGELKKHIHPALLRSNTREPVAA